MENVKNNFEELKKLLLGALQILEQTNCRMMWHCDGDIRRFVVDLVADVAAPNRFDRIHDEHGHCGERGADDIRSEFAVARVANFMKPVKDAVLFVKNHFCHND